MGKVHGTSVINTFIGYIFSNHCIYIYTSSILTFFFYYMVNGIHEWDGIDVSHFAYTATITNLINTTSHDVYAELLNFLM